MRQRITEFQLREQAASLGSAQYAEQLEEAGADLAAVAQSITEGNVRLHGLQAEIDRLHREITALGGGGIWLRCKSCNWPPSAKPF